MTYRNPIYNRRYSKHWIQINRSSAIEQTAANYLGFKCIYIHSPTFFFLLKHKHVFEHEGLLIIAVYHHRKSFLSNNTLWWNKFRTKICLKLSRCMPSKGQDSGTNKSMKALCNPLLSIKPDPFWAWNHSYKLWLALQLALQIVKFRTKICLKLIFCMPSKGQDSGTNKSMKALCNPLLSLRPDPFWAWNQSYKLWLALQLAIQVVKRDPC